MKYPIKAAIIDLDGVITHTAEIHSRAWKEAFEIYNRRRVQEGKEAFSPYSPTEDYPRYIDGIPRLDGVSNFLRSRGIDLPPGNPSDGTDQETIHGIGNLKNQIYKDLVDQEGVGVFQENVQKLKDWKSKGLKLAVISSSKNCQMILEKAGLTDLFEVRVDGLVSQQLQIPGKPAPDIFLAAAKQLGVAPNESLVVEDALAGVEAGKKGDFRLVIGISNSAGEEALKEKGADLVVGHLGELDLSFKQRRNAAGLPSALKCFGQVTGRFPGKRPLIFLDFDGTLSPIVEHHADAAISEEMRDLVEELSHRFPVAVISGRGLADVRQRVGIPELFYAGSHGFEISGPGGFSRDHQEAVRVIPVFNELEPVLKERLREIPGVDFERKKFTLAIHYRQVPPEKEATVHEIVSRSLEDHPEVKAAGGKKVIEIRPAIDWHKGKAVAFLKKELTGETSPFSIYVGDDVTDEDAFEYEDNGIGVLVGEHGMETFADYRLEDQRQVSQFLRKLLGIKIDEDGRMENKVQ